MICRRRPKRNVMPAGTCAIATSVPVVRVGSGVNGLENAAPENAIAESRMSSAAGARATT